MDDRVGLVTGSTGYVGGYLVTALIEAGWTVRATGRRPRPDHLPPEADYRSADLPGDDDLAPLVDGVTHVFHLAGASSSRSDEEEMERVNVGGTTRLVEAATDAKVERFLHMSTTAVYGEEEQLPLPVKEDVEPHPSRGYGKAKLGAEQAVWKAADAGLPVVILRPVSVYGPGAVKLLGSAILDVAIERRAGLDQVEIHREPIEQRMLHLDDLIGATLHLAEHPDAAGRAFNVTSGVYPSSHEVAEAIGAEFGMGVELAEDPDCGLPYDERTKVREEMLADGMTDDIIFTEQRFRFMRKTNPNNRVSIDALLSTDFELKETDVGPSIARTVAWYRDHRWII
ncbi:MAG TPA: NAD(P)-dependent oxidoreductase [Acidimicrobiales bacterium]|nr:NAD(P)-dependent oxidoreductase [Acidimicrobiales bacterium]